MSHEIYYTSAPEGLKPASSGFCTVGTSENIPKPLWDRLETLSAYRHQFTTATGSTEKNPVSYAHWLLNIAGASYHVLSRVCDSGVDHTQRTNAFADHLVIENNEMAAGGPAWMLMQDILADGWDGEVGTLPPRTLPQGDVAPAICNLWKKLARDAGWGGHLADLFVKSPTKPVCILFSADQEILPLIAEAIALLPPSARWLVTFNTYFTSMPTSATCAWRCCLAGSPAAQLGMRYASTGLILDLTDPERLGVAPDGPYATLARTGVASTQKPKPTSVKAKPVSGRPAAKPSKSAGVYDFDDEEDEEKEFEFEITEPGEEAAEESAVAAVPPVVPPPLKRLKPIMREAEAERKKIEISADHAAARRRKQFVILFFSALGALAVGMALVIVAMRNSSPPDVMPVVKPGTSVPPPTTIAAVTPVQPPVPVPVPIVPKPQPVVATRPAVILPPIVPTPPAPVPIHYPAVIKVGETIKPPALESGTLEAAQNFAIPAGQLDPAQAISDIKFLFPPPMDGKAELTENDAAAGTLVAASESGGGKPSISLRWKTANDIGAGTELATIGFNRNHPSLELTWKIPALNSRPEAVPLAYWLLQNSGIELQTPRGAAQRIMFAPFAPPEITLETAESSVSLPASLPPALDPVITSTLPAGWTASPYIKNDDKNPAMMSIIARGLSFKKSYGPIDAYFVVTFDSTYQKIQCNYAQRVAADTDELAKNESDLRAIEDNIKRAMDANGGAMPSDDTAKGYVQQRDNLQAIVNDYKAAIGGYNELNDIDISLQLPGKEQVMTFHMRRSEK